MKRILLLAVVLAFCGVASADLKSVGGGGTGSGTVNSGTSGQCAYYAATGTAVSGCTVGSGLTLASATLSASTAINAQVGTSYTIASTDAGKLVTTSNAAAIAITLPQATTAGFGAGFSFDLQNLGVGTVTITPTVSTINGKATLAITTNTGCSIVSDGTNYQISACTAITAGAGGAISINAGFGT